MSYIFSISFGYNSMFTLSDFFIFFYQFTCVTNINVNLRIVMTYIPIRAYPVHECEQKMNTLVPTLSLTG